MSSCKRDNDGLTFGEAVMAFLMLAGMLYVAWIILRWIIETREGKVVAGVATVAVANFALVGAIIGPPSTGAAATDRPAFSAPRKLGGSLGDGGMTTSLFAVSPDGQSYASMTSSRLPEARTEVRRIPGGHEVCVTLGGATDCRPLAR